jgi:group I intron endonuclease
MIGIYKITSPTGRVYVGQSVDCESRWKNYSGTCKSQTKLYRSFNKYGIHEHTFEIIEECLQSNLNSRERYWQEHYNVLEEGLNCRLQATDSKSGKMSKESILKRSATKRKLGQKPPNKTGTKQTIDHIKKRVESRPQNIGCLISKAKKGKSNGQQGSIWVNNGIKNTKIFDGKIPIGYIRGRISWKK